MNDAQVLYAALKVALEHHKSILPDSQRFTLIFLDKSWENSVKAEIDKIEKQMEELKKEIESS